MRAVPVSWIQKPGMEYWPFICTFVAPEASSRPCGIVAHTTAAST